MPVASGREPMKCPRCGAEMNHHAEKLVDPRDAAEAAGMDPAMGGVVQEIHACPVCGTGAMRPGR